MSQYGYRRKDGMYGLDADLKRKNDAKYKQDDEDEARAWLSALLEVSLEGDFYEVLKDGMVLCQAINRISPGLIRKINKQKVPFMQMENIGNYLDACRALGMADTLIFLTVDLYEKKNMYQVLQNILALANLCGSVEGYSGPVLDLPDANGGGFDGGAPFEPEDVPAAVAVVAEAVTAPEPDPVSPPEPEPISPPDDADEPAQAVPEPIVVEAQVADEDVPEFSDKATALVTLLESLGAPEVKNAFMAAEALNPGKINEIVEAILQEFSE